MEGDDRRNPVQESARDDGPRAEWFAFFGGLKDEPERTRKSVALSLDREGHTQNGGRVHVVSAGVHDAPGLRSEG